MAAWRWRWRFPEGRTHPPCWKRFLPPIEPLGEYLKQRRVAWTYYRDAPSLRLLDDQPEHGCDLCRYRRRAVYEVAHGLGANVIAFGHTATATDRP